MWFDGERCDIFFRTMVRHAMTKKSIKIVHYKQQSRENNNVNKEKQELHCPNAAEPQSILLSSISAEH
jgi:NADH:ubiquinone oxidoreductase subunit D